MDTDRARSLPHEAESLYYILHSFFSEHAAEAVELDITDGIAEPIRWDSSALAIRPKELAKVYLIARDRFFRHDELSELQTPAKLKANLQADDESGIVRFKEVPILLLFAPEHVSAANLRKHVIRQSVLRASFGRREFERASVLLKSELCLLDSFMQSPLPKHNKSPTLWAHRFWVLQNLVYLHRHTRSETETQEHARLLDKSAKMCIEKRPILEHELQVVLKAADRHFANYVAFDYAKRMLNLLNWSSEECPVMAKIMQWCFAHPRDISGWLFLAFVIRQEGSPTSAIDDTRVSVRRFLEQTGLHNKSISCFLQSTGWSSA